MFADLAVAAGNALVQAVVTDAWEKVRQAVARLFGRGDPDPRIEQRLDATRQELTTAPLSDLPALRSALAGQWATRFDDLLADHPEAEPEVAVLVQSINAGLSLAAGDHSVVVDGDLTVFAQRGVAAVVVHGDVSLGPTTPGRPPRQPGPASAGQSEQAR